MEFIILFQVIGDACGGLLEIAKETRGQTFLLYAKKKSQRGFFRGTHVAFVLEVGSLSKEKKPTWVFSASEAAFMVEARMV